jgi:hypothetical protein
MICVVVRLLYDCDDYLIFSLQITYNCSITLSTVRKKSVNFLSMITVCEITVLLCVACGWLCCKLPAITIRNTHDSICDDKQHVQNLEYVLRNYKLDFPI